MAAVLNDLLANPPQDTKERREVSEVARQLYMSCEEPFDTMHRLFWSVQQLPIVQVGVNLDLFRALSTDPSKPCTAQQLAETLNADPVFLSRLLRYLRSFGLLREVDKETYQATAATQWLATPGAAAGVKHYNTTISKIFSAVPEFFAKSEYRNPTDPASCAFNLAWQTDKPAYGGWVPEDPTLIPAFMEFMKSQRATQRSWVAVFPMDRLQLSGQDLEKDRVLFVDVGGSAGHQCVALRKQHPELQGRIVVQDQEGVVSKLDHAHLATLHIEAQGHDFFTPQPVRGAKAYYLRNIMHDWPDEACVKILNHLKEALEPDSMILMDEMVLPDTNASWKQTQKDIQMMAGLGAMERSESQWRDLMRKAGLKVEQIWTYDGDMGDSILVVSAA